MRREFHSSKQLDTLIAGIFIVFNFKKRNQTLDSLRLLSTLKFYESPFFSSNSICHKFLVQSDILQINLVLSEKNPQPNDVMGLIVTPKACV